MKSTRSIVLLSIIALALGNWSNDQTTVDASGLKKNRVNFYGTLHTDTGEIYNVDNISIGRMTKQIPVYEPPNSRELILPSDPKQGIITKLDLTEVQEIRVHHPVAVWNYQKSDGSRKTEYLMIAVRQGNQINSYLIDANRKLICDQISPSGPIEKEVPFKSLDRIIINGYKQREETKAPNNVTKETANKQNDCGCPTAMPYG